MQRRELISNLKSARCRILDGERVTYIVCDEHLKVIPYRDSKQNFKKIFYVETGKEIKEIIKNAWNIN